MPCSRAGSGRVESSVASVGPERWPRTDCDLRRSVPKNMNRREALCGLLGMAGSKGILRATGSPERLDLGAASLYVSISSDDFSLGSAALFDWASRSALPVVAYFGRLPVPDARLYITV